MKLLKNEYGYLNYLAVFILLLLSIVVISFMELGQTQLQSSKMFEKSLPNRSVSESAVVFTANKLHSMFVTEEQNSYYNNTTSRFKNLVVNEGCTPTSLKGFTDVANPPSIVTCIDELSAKQTSRRFEITSTSTVATGKSSLKDSAIYVVEFTHSDVNNGNISYNVLKWTRK